MFQPGHPKIPGSGRQADQITRATREVKAVFAKILQGNIHQYQEWLERVAKKNPAKALELMIEISKRFVPTLAQHHLEVDARVQIIPPTINIIADEDATIIDARDSADEADRKLTA